MKTSLYRYFSSGGDLLYIGISIYPFQREKQHRRDKDMTQVRYVELEWFGTYAEASEAERHAIQQERPIWNVVHKPKPRNVRITQIPAKPVVIVRADPDEKRPPVLTGCALGRYFGCGETGAMLGIVTESYTFPSDEEGAARVCKVARHGDVIVVDQSSEMTADLMLSLTDVGVHLCTPLA